VTKITKTVVILPVFLNKNFLNGSEHWAVSSEELKIFVVGKTPRQALVAFANKIKAIKNEDLKKVLE